MADTADMEEQLERFTEWLKENGGTIDEEHIGFKLFDIWEGGRGIVALRDIPEGHTLFTIPRSLTFSTRTSALPELFGLEDWVQWKLNTRWVGLILCMMWEQAQGTSSHWAPYFDILPTKFNTPTFFNKFELKQLNGTAVEGKIDTSEAEQDFKEILVPAVKSRPDLFPREKLMEYYSLRKYHMMGSRIMSRSFTVEPVDASEAGPSSAPYRSQSSSSRESSMDVDGLTRHGGNASKHSDDNDFDEDDDDEEDDDSSANTAMVPMADMLNARYKSENAKLFYEFRDLKMVTTKPIQAGEQILNTYGDLPNAELLRRYGYVDLLPLPDGKLGNPGDVIEISAKLVYKAVKEAIGSDQGFIERIDWWLDEGGDDVFIVESDLEFPPDLLSFVRLLMMPEAVWQRTKEKGKPPKPRLDSPVVEVLSDVIDAKAVQYENNLQWDEGLMEIDTDGPLKWRLGVWVRIGERRIVDGLQVKLQGLKDRFAEEIREAKRKAARGEDGRSGAKRLRQS